ncbi:MAG: adenine phosphoribosyltransferase [Bacteroidales bacterium]|nr:adenine phosphoribosyltransferase [Bacteroidales bacterium]
MSLELIKNEIRNIPDFPTPGIQFKDITTVLKQADLFSFLVDTLAEIFQDKGITKIACIESRGFILGGALAGKIGAGFVPIRKPGKLPAETLRREYSLEYGTDAIEIHKDAIIPGDVVLLHDDLLATGGTASAAVALLKGLDPSKICLSFLCELDFLEGRKHLQEYEVSSLIHF